MSTGGQRSSSCGGVVKLSFYRSSPGKWATVHWRCTQESTFTEMHHSTTSRKFLSLKRKIVWKTVTHKYAEFQTLKSNSSSETLSKFFLCQIMVLCIGNAHGVAFCPSPLYCFFFCKKVMLIKHPKKVKVEAKLSPINSQRE